MSEATTYDALVIGGGPGGSATASFLARGGRRVLVLEKEFFPRFHIGESLLPYNHEIFRDMGVLPRLEAAGLIRKHGAQFHLGNGSKVIGLVFRNGIFTRHTETFQVERASFDQLLLNFARESGAEVREGWTVTRTTADADFLTVEARDPDDKPAQFRARFVIDASGRANLTGNQEKLRVIHPRLKKLAVFGHFSGVRLDADEKAGDTIIVRLENKWFWLIPLAANKVSVGCVMDAEEFNRSEGSPEQIFTAAWRSSCVLQERMQQAQLLGKMHTTSDFSYRNQRLVGQRLLRVGDAAGFMDPIFSAGVYLAMHSGRQAARLVLAALEEGNDGRRRLKRYEAELNQAMKLYWRLVEGYYSKPFLDLFMQPLDKFEIPSAVTALLAGELQGGWKVKWRVWLFFALVAVQKRWPLLAPISFAPLPPSSAESNSSPEPEPETARHG